MLRSEPLKITAEVIADRGVRGIVALAKNWNADLIVVGTEERIGVKRLMSHGTAVAVANRAACSVRVIRGNNIAHREQLPRVLKTEEDGDVVTSWGSLDKAA